MKKSVRRALVYVSAIGMVAAPNMAFASVTDDPDDPTDTPERCLINVPMPNGEWFRYFCWY